MPRVLNDETDESVKSHYDDKLSDDDESIIVEYTIYARNVRDGSILWSEMIGTASISGERQNSTTSTSVSDGSFPQFGSSGDFWSALLPFDLATAPGRFNFRSFSVCFFVTLFN